VVEPEIFSCGATSFTPSHILTAAAFWGELDEHYVESKRRRLALDRAREEGIEISDEELQARSERFRREFGLRTARATESWMAARGVTVDAFTDFLERDAALALVDGASVKASRKHPTRDEETMAVLWADAVFTGAGDVWSRRLAVRAAAARDVAEGAGIPASIFDTLGGDVSEGMLPWLDHFGLDAAWFTRLRVIDAAFAHFSSVVQTPARLDEALRTQWDSLVAVQVELGGFPTESAAREAFLCVSEDGMSLEEICREAGGHYNQGALLLGDLPLAIRAQALSTPAGSLLPVFPWGESMVLCRLLGKTEPSLSDPRTNETVRAAVLDGALQPLMKRHIVWTVGGGE
jgi:hypothetical protein